MEQHDSALAFPQVAVRLLAVDLRDRLQIEQIVAYLEGNTGKMTDLHEWGKIGVHGKIRPRRSTAQDANAKWGNYRVPAGLLVRHSYIVTIGQVEFPFGDPRQLDGLALDGLTGHSLDLAEYQQSLVDTDVPGLSSNNWTAITLVASPTFTATGAPLCLSIVMRPRRRSDASSTSS